MWGFGNVARQLGVVAVIAAVVLPAVIPHLPTRYILDGLGRGDGGIGRGGRVGFNSTVDLTRSLQSGDNNIVLTYRTSAPRLPCCAWSWRRTTSAASGRPVRRRPDPAAQPESGHLVASPGRRPAAAGGVELLSSPNVASVARSWRPTSMVPRYADPTTGDLYAQARPESYSLTYREVDVKPEQLQAGIAGAPSGWGSLDVQASTTVDAAIAARVHELTDTVTAETTTPYAAAAAIQKWLRTDGGFSKPRPAAPGVGPGRERLASGTRSCGSSSPRRVLRPVRVDHGDDGPLEGNSARMALGFLPGTQENGVYTVRSSDAHAWPSCTSRAPDGCGSSPPPRFEPAPPRSTRSPRQPAPERPRRPRRTPAPRFGHQHRARSRRPRGRRGDRRPGRFLRRPGPGLARASRCTFCSSPSSWACSAAWSCPLPRSSSTVDAVRRRRRPASWPRPSGTSWSRASATSGVPQPSGGGTLREWRQHYVREALPRPAGRRGDGHRRRHARAVATPGRVRHRSP